MRAIRFSMFLMVLGLLGTATDSLAQAPGELATGMWTRVQAVPPGDELVVKLTDGKKVKGRVSSVSDTGLALLRGKRTVDFDREQVLQVYRLVPKSPMRHTLLGALGGFGAFAVGHAALLPDEPAPTHGADAVLAPVSAGIGAAVGYAIGRRAKRRVLIYNGDVSKVHNALRSAKTMKGTRTVALGQQTVEISNDEL